MVNEYDDDDELSRDTSQYIDKLRKELQSVINNSKGTSFGIIEDALLMTLMDAVFTGIKIIAEKAPLDVTKRVVLAGLRTRFEVYLSETERAFDNKYPVVSKERAVVPSPQEFHDDGINNPSVMKEFDELMFRLGVDPNVKH